MSNRTVFDIMTNLLTMASQVPNTETTGIWGAGGGTEPPFQVEICVHTLLSSMSKHKEIMAELERLRDRPDSEL